MVEFDSFLVFNLSIGHKGFFHPSHLLCGLLENEKGFISKGERVYHTEYRSRAGIHGDLNPWRIGLHPRASHSIKGSLLGRSPFQLGSHLTMELNQITYPFIGIYTLISSVKWRFIDLDLGQRKYNLDWAHLSSQAPWSYTKFATIEWATIGMPHKPL